MVLALVLCWTQAAFADVAVPPLTGRVVDTTNTLSSSDIAAQSSRLQDLQPVIALLEQTPAVQASVVHASWSSQSAAVVQGTQPGMAEPPQMPLHGWRNHLRRILVLRRCCRSWRRRWRRTRPLGRAVGGVRLVERGIRRRVGDRGAIGEVT